MKLFWKQTIRCFKKPKTFDSLLITQHYRSNSRLLSWNFNFFATIVGRMPSRRPFASGRLKCLLITHIQIGNRLNEIIWILFVLSPPKHSHFCANHHHVLSYGWSKTPWFHFYFVITYASLTAEPITQCHSVLNFVHHRITMQLFCILFYCYATNNVSELILINFLYCILYLFLLKREILYTCQCNQKTNWDNKKRIYLYMCVV